MAITLTIGGVDRTNWIAIDSGAISRDINGTSSFRGVFRDLGRGYRPTKGQTVSVAQDGTVRFAGHIRRVVESLQVRRGSSYLQYTIEASDFNQILARRTITATYPAGASLYSIVSHVHSTVLDEEGIAITEVENPGPTLPDSLEIKSETILSLFQKLSAIFGYMFYVDFALVLHYSEFTSNAAPFNFTDSSDNWFDLEIERSDDGYRNRQHERTEYQVTGTRIETYIAVLTNQFVFPTNFVITSLTSIKVNGVAKTFVAVATGGTPPGSGYGFYYYTDSAAVLRLDQAIAIGDSVEISYSPGMGNIVTVNDEAEQAARAALEGGSGIWEATEEQRNITNYDTLEAIATGRLRQYGNDGIKGRIRTDSAGLEPSMRITINVAVHAINLEVLIERIEYSWVAAMADFFRHTVQFTSVEPFGRSLGYMEKVVQMSRIGAGPVAAIAAAPAAASSSDGYHTITYGTSITPDLANGLNHQVVLTGNVAVAAPIYTGGTIASGQKMRIKFIQDGTGGRRITWNSAYLGLEGYDPDMTALTWSAYEFTRNPDGKWELRNAPLLGRAV